MSRKLIKTSITDGLDQLYKLTSTYSDSLSNDNKSKTRLAAATAASLLGASIEKINSRQSSDNRSSTSLPKDDQRSDRISLEGAESLSSEDLRDLLEDDSILNDNEELQGAVKGKKLYKQDTHFIDILLEKLLLHAMPTNVPDKDDFEMMINNPLRKETEPLSISLFTNNVRKSTANLSDFFRFQWFLVKVFNWSNPSLTFMFLICASIVVIYPYVVFVLPLLHIIMRTIIPAYLHRHPLEKVELLAVKPRGDSLLNKFFCLPKDEKQFEQYLDQEIDIKAQETEEMKQRMLELDEQLDENTKMLRKNMEFWVNMRDLQNSMIKMNKMSDGINRFFYQTAAFKDETVTTSMFFKYAGAIFVILYFGNVLPWKFIMIFSMWFRVMKTHPKISPKYDELYQRLFGPHIEELNKPAQKTERHDIIIDEAPEVKVVEIFEIYIRSLTNLNEWVFLTYSTSEYLPQDTTRKLQKLPEGVNSINSIKPPKTWRFHSETWNIDYDVAKWCEFRNIDVNDQRQGLSYHDEYLVDENFRRRRLWREVIRYSRPVKRAPRPID
ncbi:hypothetical protein WICPIJ_002513 [Wickerhamomyces pijperi]|uniref:TECPR1-like DysF domain-containing protein n=1 Tax=Wickerhamomyces pijperi TaxID=599730 RepID=A0A9P8TNW0_WICPI|nr:hypothetical protein WICPIJ_002513 [Wickerhamomyces pijperi]